MNTPHNLDRIVEIGRRRGSLTIEDLSEYFPIETLSAAELVDIVATIENAGVTIEVDPRLLKGRPRLVTPAAPNSLPTATDGIEKSRERLSALDSSIRESKRRIRPARTASRYKGGTVFVAGAAIFCVFILIGMWFISRGV